jgi:hypothetical protein
MLKQTTQNIINQYLLCAKTLAFTRTWNIKMCFKDEISFILET